VFRQEWLLQIYGTASITSEEDEMMKKEREIIEILEKEERWRYNSNTTSEEKDIGKEGNDILCHISFT
jgi:F-box protein 20